MIPVVTFACIILQSDRLHKILDFVSTVHDLCAVLGLDFFSTVTEVHPSLNDSVSVQSKSISNDTLSKLSGMVMVLKEDKKMRLKKVSSTMQHHIGSSVVLFSFMLMDKQHNCTLHWIQS